MRKPRKPDWAPEMIAFCCSYCAQSAAAMAGSKRMQYPVNVRIIHTPCTGKLEVDGVKGKVTIRDEGEESE